MYTKFRNSLELEEKKGASGICSLDKRHVTEPLTRKTPKIGEIRKFFCSVAISQLLDLGIQAWLNGGKTQVGLCSADRKEPTSELTSAG
ncbi:hypothetical protein PoB_001925000 [Plakobranchus ocellatus]|uniref:Uncharacterized protein n=1 Tax=Plakobranchus ocellatus TaxID=259542 RepID=A0AAV3ZC68_9GAST|nr:hypothetical protein PoB_001925000 [Plakobranchus ocellatus]